MAADLQVLPWLWQACSRIAMLYNIACPLLRHAGPGDPAALDLPQMTTARLMRHPFLLRDEGRKKLLELLADVGSRTTMTKPVSFNLGLRHTIVYGAGPASPQGHLA